MSERAIRSEQRRHPRAPVGRPIRYRHRGLTRAAVVAELSEGGAGLRSEGPPVPGEQVRLFLPLDEWGGSRGGCEVDGEVVRTADGEVGVAFNPRLLPRHMLLLRDFVWRASLSQP